MGTTYNVKFISPEKHDIKVLKKSVDDHLKKINQSLSTWIHDSEISKFSFSTSVEKTKISDGFYANLKKANEISEKSNGALDVTVMPLVNLWGFGWKGRPKTEIEKYKIDSVMAFVGYKKLTIYPNSFIKKSHTKLQVDLSAIAKGYGVDEIANIIKQENITDFLVEIGGETVTSGFNKLGKKWRVGIEKPDLNQPYGNSIQQIISISDKAFATSGNYRNFYELNGKRYAHTIDPRTGYPVSHQLASVTVVAKSCMVADAIATTLMVMGEKEGIKWVNSLPDVDAYFIVRENDSFKNIFTNGFKQYIEN